MQDFIQTDFSSGMNLFSHDTKLSDTEYGLSFNILNRDSALECIKEDEEDIAAPVGKKQGLFAFDKYLVLFNQGLCFYREVDDTEWIQIDDIFVNPSVDYIFAQAVPASTFNFVRVLDIPDRIDGTSASTNVTTKNTLITTTNEGLVVQDGLSQGWFISPLAEATRLKKYLEWTQDDRTYVPIMRQMAYMNGILFGIAPDKRRILRSVSGRPLDFVVNVDVHGNKGGDANTTDYAVGYDAINCLRPLNSGELMVGTSRNLFPIEFNFDKVIFQEPTFLNRKPIYAGVINQESFIDILGDYAFIDFDGLRSFNAVSMLTNEGRNSIFSILIAKAFAKIKQTTLTASIVFDNYAIFSVLTNFGNVLALYDTLRQKWASFVELENPIKQFAVADQSENPTLYAITESKVFKLFSSSTRRTGILRPKAFNISRADTELKLQNVRAVFDNPDVPATATATEVINNKEGESVVQELGKARQGIYYPVMYPVTFFDTRSTDVVNFNFRQLGTTGWKVSPKLSWNNASKLLLLHTQVDEKNNTTSLDQQSSLYNK